MSADKKKSVVKEKDPKKGKTAKAAGDRFEDSNKVNDPKNFNGGTVVPRTTKHGRRFE